MRTCFESRWRLFRGSEQVTPGRWVFCPDGTPAYPGFTWLGSRDWTSDDYAEPPPLGEDRTFKRKYYSGQPPARYPPAARLGEDDCIQSGEQPGHVSPGLEDGYDLRCWALAPVPPPPLVLALDVTWPAHQLELARLTQGLYVNPDLAGVQLQALLGPGSVVSVVPNTASPLPGTIIGRQGDLIVVVVSGTANPQQWALQPLTSFAGVQDFGAFGTLAFWWLAAQAVQARILALAPPAGARVVLVGHSMGGAIATILAGRYVANDPGARVQLLTFGSPRPGDARLQALVRALPQANFVDDNDPITAIPPSGVMLGWLSLLVPAPVRLRWNDWVPPSQRTGLSPEGVRRANPPATDVFREVYQAVSAAVNGQPIPTFSAHNMSEYLRRLGGGVQPGVDMFPGMVCWSGGSVTPVGWLPANGALVSRAIYADLFNVIGTTWGAGDGTTTFQLPDLRGRSPLGAGQGAGLSLRTLGQTGGEEDHVLLEGELAEHAHVLNDAGHSHGITDPGHGHSVQVTPTGGGAGDTPSTEKDGGLTPYFTDNQATGVSVDNATTGLTMNQQGLSNPHNTMHPWAALSPFIKT